MPQLGTLDVAPLLAGAPTMPDVQTAALVVPNVEILQVLYEVRSEPMLEVIPASLHPTLPPTITFVVWKSRDSELGDFTMTQVRIGCRAGVRPRGFLLSSVIDNADSAAQLGVRWGYRADPGTPTLVRSHDRVHATVERDGEPILDVSLVSPEPISGGDVQYVANMNLAHTPDGPRLVQVDPEFEFHRADRGSIKLDVFDAAAWGDARLVPSWPVSCSYTVADVTLPRLRYLCKVDVPALQGTEVVR